MPVNKSVTRPVINSAGLTSQKYLRAPGRPLTLHRHHKDFYRVMYLHPQTHTGVISPLPNTRENYKQPYLGPNFSQRFAVFLESLMKKITSRCPDLHSRQHIRYTLSLRNSPYNNFIRYPFLAIVSVTCNDVCTRIFLRWFCCDIPLLHQSHLYLPEPVCRDKIVCIILMLSTEEAFYFSFVF